LYTDELWDPPRGEDEADEGPWDWSWARAGSRSAESAVRGVFWEPNHESSGPREWTCEMDGSSSFAAVRGNGQESWLDVANGIRVRRQRQRITLLPVRKSLIVRSRGAVGRGVLENAGLLKHTLR
jgi:hypothetical protein